MFKWAVRILSWLKILTLWFLLEWWALWLAIVFPLICYAFVSQLTDDLEGKFRLSGMILQLAGFGTIVWSLDGRLQSLKGFGLVRAIVDRFSRFPRWRKRGVTIHAEGLMAGTAMVSGRMRVIASKNSGLERRVDLLEEEVGSLSSELQAMSTSLNKELADLGSAMQAEVQERKQNIDALSRKLSRAFTDGVAFESVGIWFFVLGIILASASPELARILAG